MNNDRRLESRRFRNDAAELAFNREHPEHLANGDEQKFASSKYAMSFTKGLDHDPATGLIVDKNHFEAFRQAIDNAVIEPFTTRVPVPTAQPRRKWEAPTAGVVFDLEGPDAQAVTMPPAPELCSDELTFEMAEVYELALLRDVPLTQFDINGPSPAVNDSVDRLNNLRYAKDGFPGRPRTVGSNGKLNRQTVFRGSSPGVEEGPYLSQFMVMGNDSLNGAMSVKDGFINYGAQMIDQRVPAAPEGDDYMVDFGDWLQVQQGYDVNAVNGTAPGQALGGQDKRFIHTPRDLATYVHFDALYQTYLNACLILLSSGTAFDPGFDNLSGSSDFKVMTNAVGQDMMDANSGGFALYGGPHILTLVTEVATRALKAVRFQKFNTHIRSRPEVLAARLEKAKAIEKANPSICGCFTKMAKDLKKTTELVRKHNQNLPAPRTSADTILLPMAFAEGSPMHPSYGAGHATVAGACVTILKAFFDTSAVLADVGGKVGFYTAEQIAAMGGAVDYIQYETVNDGKELDTRKAKCPLTLEGELNKLAANISIGRNMAGVHYFSDYYDSARMGEAVAIGMLEEQALGYPTDPFVMSVPTFDGDVVRIGAR